MRPPQSPSSAGLTRLSTSLGSQVLLAGVSTRSSLPRKYYIPTPNEQRRTNTLRLIALTTNEPLARTVALDELGESEDQARYELSQTCWAEDMSNLRTAAEANFKSK